MDSCNDTPQGGLPHSDIHGSKPARGSPWLFAACHVLHRLLVPRHPPNALIILRSSGQIVSSSDQSSVQRQSITQRIEPRHRNHLEPTRGEPRRLDRSVGSQSSSAQNPDFCPFLEENGTSSGSIHTNASEHSLSDLGAHGRAQNPKRGVETPDTLSRSDINRTTESVDQCPVVSCQNYDNAAPNRRSDYTRPETHQNLIHPDKEQNRPNRRYDD